VATPTFINEFWTSKQRHAHSLHEISYRACFKPQLPRFFIERLTDPGEIVYDPFAGRGTTAIEAALLDRVPFACDVNPLSQAMIRPRLTPPTKDEVAARLEDIDLSDPGHVPQDFLVFYHIETLREICALRKYLLQRDSEGTMDILDMWIRMVALNRLTGHSPGFFSVYTLPPNQAVSVESQKRINERRRQDPPRRDVRERILRKTKSLLAKCDDSSRQILCNNAHAALTLAKPSSETDEITSDSVSLIVTSPPFLDVVDYATDNWLRGWFCGIDPDAVPITVAKRIEDWVGAMTSVFRELSRVLKPGGYLAFEVGEVRSGKIKLEEFVLPIGREVELSPVLVLINDQEFTKTANCWGVTNRKKGTNTNRIVVFRKPDR